MPSGARASICSSPWAGSNSLFHFCNRHRRNGKPSGRSPFFSRDFRRVPSGTLFATSLGMPVVRKLANSGAVGVLGNPFVPYILVLLALLRSL